MKHRSLLIAAAALLAVAVVVTSQPVLPTHRMAQGLSMDPDSGCVYVIFIDAIKFHCRDTAPEVVTDLVEPPFFGGRTIVRWSERTDINGRLYLITEDTSTSVPSMQLLIVGRLSNATFVTATSVLVGNSGVGINKRRDFLLRSDRQEFFFLGKVGSQPFGLYTIDSTATTLVPTFVTAFAEPQSNQVAEPLFLEIPSTNSVYFRAFETAATVASLQQFSLVSRTVSPVQYVTATSNTNRVDVFGPVAITLSAALTFSWVVRETNGSHTLYSACFNNASATTQQCRSTLVATTSAASFVFKGVTSFSTGMQLLSDVNYFSFPSTVAPPSLRLYAPSGSPALVEAIHDGIFGNRPMVLVRGSSNLFIGTFTAGGAFATALSPADPLSDVIGAANNLWFYTQYQNVISSADLFISDANLVRNDVVVPLSSCFDSRLVDRIFGVVALHLPAPRDLIAYVTIFEDGAKLSYLNATNNDLGALSSVSLFPRILPGVGSLQPTETSLVAKLDENNLLVSAGAATYDDSILLLVRRASLSSAFTARQIRKEASTACNDPFNTARLASSTAPSANYALITDGVSSPLPALQIYFVDLRNASSPAIPLRANGNQLSLGIDDRVQDARIPAVHLPDDRYCILASNTSDPLVSRLIFCFQRQNFIAAVSLPSPAIRATDFSVGLNSQGSPVLYYTCQVSSSGGAGSGVCSYTPFAASPVVGPRVSDRQNDPIGLMQIGSNVLGYPIDPSNSSIIEFFGGNVVSSSSVATRSYPAAVATPPQSVYGMYVLVSGRSKITVERCFNATECYTKTICDSCSGSRDPFLCGAAKKGAALIHSKNNSFVELVYASVTGANVTLAVIPETELEGQLSCFVPYTDPAVVVIVAKKQIFAYLADEILDKFPAAAPNATLVFELPPEPETQTPTLIDALRGRQLLTTQFRRVPSPFYEAQALTLSPYTFCFLDSQCLDGERCTYGICSNRTIVAPAACSPPQPPGSVCVNGAWFIPRNVTNSGNTTVGGTVVIIGSLLADQGGSLAFANNSVLNVSGCATFGGTLDLTVGLPATSGDQTVSVINFDGFCGGATQFDSTRLNVVGAAPCAKTTVKSVQYTARSVAILFNYDTSGCIVAPDGTLVEASPSTGSGGAGGGGGGDAAGGELPVGAIIGIVVAVVAVVVAIILVTIFSPRFRRMVRPYETRETRKEAHERHTREDIE